MHRSSALESVRLYQLTKGAGYTEESAVRICAAVERGLTRRLAAAFGGISPVTLQAWELRADRGEEPYAELFARIRAAEGACLDRLVSRIRRASKDDWRAAAWLTERRFKEYSDKDSKVVVDQSQTLHIHNENIQLSSLSDEELRAKLSDVAKMIQERLHGDQDPSDAGDGHEVHR